MMKRIVAVNAGPRKEWNTGALVRKAAKGAQSQGAQTELFDLYSLGPFSGCISCFACKLPQHKGVCVRRDGLTPVLEAIRSADGLILGSPNYLGNATAGFRALYERLIFQSITYNAQRMNCNERRIPVLFIMTSNSAEEYYPQTGYDKMVEGYKTAFENMVGPTRVMICGDTLQVEDYGRYDWTLFDAEAKKARHETVFPAEKQRAFDLGVEIVSGPWE